MYYNEKILLVSNYSNIPGGRSFLGKTIYKIINQLYKNQFVSINLKKKEKKNIFYYLNTLRGHIDGINSCSISKIIDIINKKKINRIFIDGSNLGEISKILKKRFPNKTIYTFYHHVECIFFWQLFLIKKSIRSFFIMLVNFLSEKKSIKYSDYNIVLNNRDSKNLKYIYGKKADYIIPLILENKFKKIKSRNLKQKKLSALFVGGNFFANILGIEWFVKNVLPYVDLKLIIVGKGMEKYKKKFAKSKNVECVGATNDLNYWYRKVHFVLSPIFHGSGMKTKIAESLMHGKKIVATKESFIGYKGISKKAGFVCNTANDFIFTIKKNSVNLKTKSFYPSLQNIFLKKYSYKAGLKYYNKLFTKNKV